MHSVISARQCLKITEMLLYSNVYAKYILLCWQTNFNISFQNWTDIADTMHIF